MLFRRISSPPWKEAWGTFSRPQLCLPCPLGAEGRLGFVATSRAAQEVAPGLGPSEVTQLGVWMRLGGEQFWGPQMVSLLHRCICPVTGSVHLGGLQILALGERWCQAARNWCCHRHRVAFVITGLMNAN